MPVITWTSIFVWSLGAFLVIYKLHIMKYPNTKFPVGEWWQMPLPSPQNILVVLPSLPRSHSKKTTARNFSTTYLGVPLLELHKSEIAQCELLCASFLSYSTVLRLIHGVGISIDPFLLLGSVVWITHGSPALLLLDIRLFPVLEYYEWSGCKHFCAVILWLYFSLLLGKDLQVKFCRLSNKLPGSF